MQLFGVEITRFVPREVTRALLTMLMIYLFLRFGTVLAGVALRPGLTLVEGWNATKGEGVVFGLLALCLFVVFSLGGIMTQRGGDGPIAWVAHAVWEWGYMMFYLSVLTTLYGHYIEKRAL